jgi:hypothetical protein
MSSVVGSPKSSERARSSSPAETPVRHQPTPSRAMTRRLLLAAIGPDPAALAVIGAVAGERLDWDWLLERARASALDSGGCTVRVTLDEQETGDAGDYFRRHTAGWVGGIPISLSFPITVFIVKSIPGALGCTIPFLSDYVLVSVDALKLEVVMAHEIGHRCNILPEHDDPRNLMFSGGMGNVPLHKLVGWQENFVRSSRHVTYLF